MVEKGQTDMKSASMTVKRCEIGKHDSMVEMNDNPPESAKMVKIMETQPERVKMDKWWERGQDE